MNKFSDEYEDVYLLIDALMKRKGGLSGGAFRALSIALGKYGFAFYREKFTPKYLMGLGFKPNTIIDVGVNRGTPNFWDAFPNIPIVLIDPLEDEMMEVLKKYKGYNFISKVAAAGSCASNLVLNIMPISGHSGLLTREESPADTKIVPVVRLDSYIRSIKVSGPYGIKIDTEGYELEVLKGCSEIIDEVEFIITETSVKRIYNDGYKFSDLIGIMASYGFELMDTLSSSGGAPNNIDCLFVKYDSQHLKYK